MKKFEVTVPEFRKSKLLGKDIVIRPSRVRGPRFDSEIYLKKTIYNNYGHSGFGDEYLLWNLQIAS